MRCYGIDFDGREIGKSDALEETPWDTARREAFEEIGLPLDDSKLPAPFRIEHLCELPMNLARTELGVRPCVAFISATTPPSSSSPSANQSIPAVEDILIPRLNAKEVAAVFTAPFHNFLRTVDEESYASTSAEPEAGAEAAGFPASWYNGSWTDWHDIQWRMHNFYVPVANQIVRKPKSKPKPLVSPLPYADQVKMNEEDPLDKMKRFRVFGMTARILVDAARVAYDEEPEFEHNSHFGDEDMIGRLLKIGRLGAIKKSDDQITREDLAAAAKI